MSSEHKASGLKAPSKIGKASGIAKPVGSSTTSLNSSRPPTPDNNKPVDDFIIGDRVLVGGTKPGVIAFIGETKFANGDWAGVILDLPEGKNDGSVQGVRYFQCEPKRGVFAKPSKLTRQRANGENAGSTVKVAADACISSTPKVPKSESKRDSLLPAGRANLPKKNGSISASNTSLSSAAMATIGAKHIKIGERVVVNGVKVGTLRYLGTTDFAAGEWAGVELDEALGKNDGSVAGRRYFECKPQYGLFAPVHKVTKQGIVAPPTSGRATPSLAQQRSSHRLSTTSSVQGGLNPKSRDLSISQESLNSIGSAVSAASRSRVRLGVTSLQAKQTQSPQQAAANRVALARQAYKGVSTQSTTSGTAALQKALKEKEEHIEQLIRERELERSEVFKASVQKEELEEQLSKLQSEFDSVALDNEFKVNELQVKVENLREEKKELELALEEQKAKYEDLQFQMEEEAISRSDQEVSQANHEETIGKLNKTIEEEQKAKLAALDQVTDLQAQLSEITNKVAESESRVSELTLELNSTKESLKVADTKLTNQLQGHEQVAENQKLITVQLEQSLSQKTSELQQKDQSNKELTESNKKLKQQLEKSECDLNQSQTSCSQLSTQLDESKTNIEKLTSQVSEVERKLKTAVEEKSSTSQELKDIKLQLSDLQRSLEAGESAKASLVDEKSKLEQQIDALMKNSGDSSQQLTLLNGELREKERKLESLQNSLVESNNKTERLQELLDTTNEDHKKQLTVLETQHEKLVAQLRIDLSDLETKKESSEQSLKSNIEEQAEEIVSFRDRVSELQSQLESQNTQIHSQISSLNEVKTSLEAQLQEEQNRVTNLEAERNGLQEQLRVVTHERDSLSQSVMEKKSEVQSLQEEQTKRKIEFEQITENYKQELASNLEKSAATEEELKLQKDKNESYIKERDTISEQKIDLEKKLKGKEAEISSLLEQVAKEKQNADNIQVQLDAVNKSSQDKMFELDEEILSLKSDIETYNSKVQSAEAQCESLIGQLESAKLEYSQSQTELKNQTKKLEKLEQDLQAVQEEKDTLQTQIFSLEEESLATKEKLKSLKEERDSLKKNVKSLEKDCEKVTKRASFAESTHVAELEGKQQEIDVQTSLIAKLQQEIEHLKNQISLSIGDTDTIRQLRQRLSQFENERDDFKKEVEDLTFKLDELSHAAAGDTKVVEKTDNSYQIDFLNSVIVDQQKKIDELNTKVKVLAEVGVDHNGYGDEDISADMSDLTSSRPPPRLFCDICDIFDAHDTDDCPIQAQDEDSPPPSHYHENREASRPYCDTCEVFGHTTEECEEPDEW